MVIHRVLTAAAACALGTVLFGQRPPAPSPSKETTAVASVIPMELVGNRPAIRVTVNGKGSFAFLVAPEFPNTVIDQALVSELQLKSQADRSGTSAVSVDLEFGGTKVAKVPATVGDVTRLVPELRVGARGIINLVFWKEQLVTIDCPSWRVTIEAGALPEPNGRDVFALAQAVPERALALTVAGHSIPFRLDPLFRGGLLLPDTYISQLPLAGQPTNIDSITTTAGRAIVREARLAEDARIGTIDLGKPLLTFSGNEKTAIFGGEWLREFTVTYDLTNARVRLTRR